MKRTITAADLFCGAGGTSTGLRQACESRGYRLELLAVNHWDVAIATHTANHPDTRHLCESLDNVDPRKVVPGGRLNLLCASPECTHHSVARGGKPINDQSRASAWHILRWAEALYIDNILIENVQEFQSWGPIGANGRPLASKRGQTFQAFLDALRSLGYVVDWRVLNAADYGDPTTRQRLFIQARRGNRKISWPDATHAQMGAAQGEMFGDKQQWRPARDIIDWTLASQSVFSRKRPLAPATMARIAAGLRKFGGRNAEPFLVVLRNHQDARSLDKPIPTLTTSGANFALCEPFIVPFNGNRSRDLDRAKDVCEPAPTVTTKDRFGLVEVDGMHLDIRFRMLQPHELAAAQGFPADYQFTGTREARVKQIGNAVPVNLARALCLEMVA